MSRQLLVNHGNVNTAGDITWANAVAGNAVPIVTAFDVDAIGDDSLDLTAPFEGKRVQFVQRPAVGESPILSPIIEKSQVEKVVKKAYEAPVAQVTTVVPATGTGYAIIRIVDASQGFKPHQRLTATVNITGKTKEQITDAFVLEINNKNPKFVTASKTGTDITLTGGIFTSFQTITDDSAVGWTITATTTPKAGSGSLAQVKQLESESQGLNASYMNRIYLPTAPPSYVGAGGSVTTYDLYTILVRTNTTPNISSANKYLELTIAAGAGNTGIDLEEFFFGVDDGE
jgi:hypothetical protein